MIFSSPYGLGTKGFMADSPLNPLSGPAGGKKFPSIMEIVFLKKEKMFLKYWNFTFQIFGDRYTTIEQD